MSDDAHGKGSRQDVVFADTPFPFLLRRGFGSSVYSRQPHAMSDCALQHISDSQLFILAKLGLAEPSREPSTIACLLEIAAECKRRSFLATEEALLDAAARKGL